MLSLMALGVLTTLQQPYLAPEGRISRGGGHLDQHQPLADLLVAGHLWVAGARAAALQGPDNCQGAMPAAATGRSHCSSSSGSGPVSTAWGADLAPDLTRSPNSQWPSRCVGNSGSQGGY